MNHEIIATRPKNPTAWPMIWGILMIVCGFLAIALPQISSIEIVIILAYLVLLAGIWHLIFAFHAGVTGGSLWHIFLSLLYGIAGVYMWKHPLISVESLTLVLAIFLGLEGVIEIALYFVLRGVRHSIWVLIDGMVTLVLGIMIWRHWPSISIWALGTLVGISLIFTGTVRILLASAARGKRQSAT